MITHQLDARARKMLEDMQKLFRRWEHPVEQITTAAGQEEKTPFANGERWAKDHQWQDFEINLTTGATGLGGQQYLYLTTGYEGQWDAVNPQFLAEVNGHITQAFDVNHTRMPLHGNTQYAIVLHGYYARPANNLGCPYFKADLCEVNTELEQLYYDLKVPYEACLLLPPEDRERETTLEWISRALDLLDLRSPNSPAFEAGIAQARDFIRTAFYLPRQTLPAQATAQCVGHTHIDVAWLWDLYQSRHKAMRSFSTVLSLMDRYPEYRFMSSQPVLYEFVKQDAPELYARIRERVSEGRWEVEGGMWVEADCNETSGESLARQFMYGQKFFETEFGKRSRILWLPDVFGYSAALPQLMKQSGIDYFMTTKISWNEFNLMPYDTFQWKGMDGSKVLTHFAPAREFFDNVPGEGHEGLNYYTTYNALLQPSQIAGGWKRFQQKALDNQYLVTYGYGDGGGGPTDWMLENARRMKTPMPNMPVVELTSARNFFEQLEQRVSGDERLPVWNGELYLEYHRATYTSQGHNKRNNRKIEIALRSAELRCLQAAAHGYPYPKATLDAVWKDVLTLQFHDILPGSSVRKVYEDSDRMYANSFQTLQTIMDDAEKALISHQADMLGVWNDLEYTRDDLMTFPAQTEGLRALLGANGETYAVQRLENQYIAYVRNLKPMGGTRLRLSYEPVPERSDAAPGLHMDEHGFDTPFYTGRFDASMRIVSLFDKRSQRELCRDGGSVNRLVCYEVRPHLFNAWEINIYYPRRHWDVDQVKSVQVLAEGPVCAALRVTYTYMQSTIVQDIRIYRDTPRIDFSTHMDWQEKDTMLKAHFPLNVFHSEATYDIQFGNVRRPTHRNTSWDIARFEVCAQKWVDISEPDYGVALLNDCKYGHSADDEGIALTLVKTSNDPDPLADIGEHVFQYALLPHLGDWRSGNVANEARAFNMPVETQWNAAVDEGSLLRLEGDGILVEAVKRAEDGEGTIVRMYENFGRHCRAVLAPSFPFDAVERCNILEDTGETLPHDNGKVAVSFAPYQIVTLRFRT